MREGVTFPVPIRDWKYIEARAEALPFGLCDFFQSLDEELDGSILEEGRLQCCRLHRRCPIRLARHFYSSELPGSYWSHCLMDLSGDFRSIRNRQREEEETSEYDSDPEFF